MYSGRNKSCHFQIRSIPVGNRHLGLVAYHLHIAAGRKFRLQCLAIIACLKACPIDEHTRRTLHVGNDRSLGLVDKILVTVKPRVLVGNEVDYLCLLRDNGIKASRHTRNRRQCCINSGNEESIRVEAEERHVVYILAIGVNSTHSNRFHLRHIHSKANLYIAFGSTAGEHGNYILLST